MTILPTTCQRTNYFYLPATVVTLQRRNLTASLMQIRGLQIFQNFCLSLYWVIHKKSAQDRKAITFANNSHFLQSNLIIWLCIFIKFCQYFWNFVLWLSVFEFRLNFKMSSSAKVKLNKHWVSFSLLFPVEMQFSWIQLQAKYYCFLSVFELFNARNRKAEMCHKNTEEINAFLTSLDLFTR